MLLTYHGHADVTPPDVAKFLVAPELAPTSNTAGAKHAARIESGTFAWSLKAPEEPPKRGSALGSVFRVLFNTKEMARKNRILAPTKVVHFYGVAKDSREQDIEVVIETIFILFLYG